jgi:hypothetical protein
MDGDGAAIETDIEFPSEPGWAVGGVMGIFQCLLEALAKAFAFI